MNRPIRAYNSKPNQTSFKPGHKKLGGFTKGDKHKPESIEKIRQSLLGKTKEQSRNWQGGKCDERQLIRSSQQFKQWRKAIFERDKYACQLCGITGNKAYLEADHIKPFAYFPELRLDINNGRTLCRECHKLTDSFAYKAIKNYGQKNLQI
jgi:predicted restriction endonuclease